MSAIEHSIVQLKKWTSYHAPLRGLTDMQCVIAANPRPACQSVASQHHITMYYPHVDYPSRCRDRR